MAKSVKRKTADRRVTAADRAQSIRADAPRVVTDTDIAQRAYDFYLARGCEPGHELEDWLRAEQELRQRSVVRAERDERSELLEA